MFPVGRIVLLVTPGPEDGVDFRAVFADTGNEHEFTYEFFRLSSKSHGRS